MLGSGWWTRRDTVRTIEQLAHTVKKYRIQWNWRTPMYLMLEIWKSFVWPIEGNFSCSQRLRACCRANFSKIQVQTNGLQSTQVQLRSQKSKVQTFTSPDRDLCQSLNSKVVFQRDQKMVFTYPHQKNSHTRTNRCKPVRRNQKLGRSFSFSDNWITAKINLLRNFAHAPLVKQMLLLALKAFVPLISILQRQWSKVIHLQLQPQKTS